jgi:hypothetical protein
MASASIRLNGAPLLDDVRAFEEVFLPPLLTVPFKYTIVTPFFVRIH